MKHYHCPQCGDIPDVTCKACNSAHCNDCGREHVDTGDGCPWCAAEPKRTRGRPRLTEGEHPVGVRVQMPQEMRDAIDATGRKRSEFIREAVREKLARG